MGDMLVVSCDHSTHLIELSSDMKPPVSFPQSLAIAALLGLSTVISAHADVVFDNTQGNLHAMYVSPVEYGDEIKLAPGSARQAQEFQFTYYSNYDLRSGAVVRLYKNDGASVLGAASPGTLLYQSSAFDIKKSDTSNPNNVVANTAVFNLSNSGLILPNTLTWTVEFSGVGSGNDASALVFDAPTVGSSYSDFWKKGSSGWDLLVFGNGTKANFNAKLSATTPTGVPDSGSTLAFLGLGMAGVCVLRRRISA